MSILTDHVKDEDNHKPQPNGVKRGRETINGLNIIGLNLLYHTLMKKLHCELKKESV